MYDVGIPLESEQSSPCRYGDEQMLMGQAVMSPMAVSKGMR